MDNKELIRNALDVRQQSYSPYSKFKVGACLEAEDGSVYCGCNIENASYSVTNCAERTAFFQAVSQGITRFRKIAIVGGYDEANEYCPPCGVCRQVMMEFCDPDFEILLGKEDLSYQSYFLKDLLPLGFDSDHL
ncbi:MAG: cytidine deaminase [Lachnospiraceae bacterium]|nr:cytidine deaminase [Lachnospiraceae bacterium]